MQPSPSPSYKIIGWETQFKGMIPAAGFDWPIARCQPE